ncbi:AAEL002150-PA [Aedes aegypti]|uniref:AAEL002150-PA n=1 Tax=Aedes aegypti TaxID=7159 RepID=Q17J28_AEDAE|nr:AAEL002150-PA [Aedes aegypti]
MYLIICSILLLLVIRGSYCDLFDVLNSGSDFDLNSIINAAFNGSDNGSVLIGEVTTPIEEEVTFWCSSESSDNLQQVHVNDPNIHNKIHFAKPITLITHGWLGNHSSFWMVQTASDILKYTNNSVCIVAWDHLASYVYPQVAQQHAPLVSDYMTRFVKFLNQQGMPPESMTLVGHSIGAHVCGQVGYNLKGKIREIYGLDPAGPLFTHPTRRESSFRLDSTDAGYVQMIVTTRFILGVNYGDGHENFYPNGGTSPQKSYKLHSFQNIWQLSAFFEERHCLGCNMLHSRRGDVDKNNLTLKVDTMNVSVIKGHCRR